MKKVLHPDHRPSFLPRATILQGRYRIGRRLGSGGMGAVYEAVDRRLNVTVALKESFSTDRRLRRQFAREARMLAKLNHPALPRVTDYFTESNRAFLVMQFIPGPDLADVITHRRGPFPRREVIAWADQVLDALVYLHAPERQIVHRDIKPHNLKVTSAGQIALLDFGLAKSDTTESSLNSRRSIFGFTRRYSPPEQIQDLGTSPRSDIYALGATLYHLFTGVKPPDAMTRANALSQGKPDPLPPAHEVYSEVGADIARVLHKALALNPDDRCDTAEEFREALRRADYARWAVANEFALAVPPQSVSTVSVSTTVAIKAEPQHESKPEPRPEPKPQPMPPAMLQPTSEPAPESKPIERIVVDNLFQLNSVFNAEVMAEEADWLLPPASRVPTFAVSIFAFMLLAFFGVRYDVAGWLLNDPSTDQAKESVMSASDKPLDQGKPYRFDKTARKTVLAGISRESSRRNDKPKRGRR